VRRLIRNAGVMCSPLGTSSDIGSSIQSAPALVGPNLLYVGADDGSLYAFDGAAIAAGTNAGPLAVVEVAGRSAGAQRPPFPGTIAATGSPALPRKRAPRRRSGRRP
jgi:hypothetical protein